MLSDFLADQVEKKKYPQKNFDTVDKSVQEVMYVKEKVPDIEAILQKNRGKNNSKTELENIEIFYKITRKKILQNKRVRVPICKIENFGPHMCIDDKNLGDFGFTIISNLGTGKIAFMIETRKSKIITQSLTDHVPQSILNGVKILTKDLAHNYEVVRRENFWNAVGVADKFHVIQLGLQAISDLRVKYRQQELTKERERREAHKCEQARNKDAAQRHGETYRIKKCPPAKKMENDETILQILSSINRALSQFQKKWGKNMRKRIKILFREFPDLKRMYRFISAFRGIYDVKKFGEEFFKRAKKSLNKWLTLVGASNISELQNFASTVNHHKQNILSYFQTGYTNAYAESLNAKLQRFLRDNFGIKNLDFFLWRINKLFS